VAIFDSAVDQPGAIRLDLSTVLCDPMTGCDAVRDGQPLYFDGNHLSLAGSALVVPPLAAAVLEQLALPD
jgi:lysophospholipase L1-like esterase